MPQSDDGLDIEDGDTTSTSDTATSEEQSTHPDEHELPAGALSPDSFITEVIRSNFEGSERSQWTPFIVGGIQENEG